MKGLGATIVRNVPANSVYLGSFEVMKREVASRQGIPVTDLNPGVLFDLHSAFQITPLPYLIHPEAVLRARIVQPP